MQKKIYSIHDTVSGIFNNPFSEVNNASAIRAFETALTNNPNCNDYVLYHIADMDDNTGELIPFTPVKLHVGFSISEKQNDNVTDIPEFLKKQSGEK